MELNKKIEMICTSSLTGKAGFQRPIEPRRVAKIAREFDKHKMMPIQVADIKDMGLIIWDGQHTAAAARVVNHNEDLLVPCIVNELTYEEAAKLVAEQEKNKKKYGGIDQFKSSVEANNPDDVNIMRVLNKHGISIDRTYKENSTAAISALRQVYAISCYDLDEALKLIKEAWPFDEDRFRPDVILAIGRLTHNYRGKYKRDDLIKRLGKKPVKVYIRDATYSGKGKSTAFRLAEQFIADYNYNRTPKYKLDISDLTNNK